VVLIGAGLRNHVNDSPDSPTPLGVEVGGLDLTAYDYLRAPAEEVLRREALEPMRSTVRLAKAELGTSAGLIGAAFVGFEALDAAA